jgi:hypothetical protein
LELTVSERLVLIQILPQEGDFATLRVVRDLRSALSFSEAELAALKFRTEGENLHWEPQPAADIDIGPRALVLIADTLKDLNTKKKLRLDQVDLYERFTTEADG